MENKYEKAIKYLIDYKEYDNEYVDNFTKPYEIDNDFKENIDTLQELIDNYSKLEKALDKACKECEALDKGLSYEVDSRGILYLDGRPQQKRWSKEQWKEYLLKESEKENGK